ncbi:amino acid/amide ABC transporter ATP-binding protein 2, HAAT family [Desulfatibacillum alkenivorans DSM 16219]|jgi:branched-chain amino acid transport system ATP-binding protein|uniref:Amino acid/amide ABC transporter ATP-binding protein 2, HAAT family n=1 Tax=Desulfatibacillum alkenivorans DSM 16219 TaxID=1121393 RepID=A0A1M7AE85_9BACT|nr:ABC transporter ATP-binding protein [Desulfatibacillum alkenivorans]SHL40954.1 amino acid/amide ABC transporter ATP-binding protein 2, HAAT family [Desulfatibacillum alkenivorans DSM 16219]
MLLEVKDINTFYGDSHVLQGVSLQVHEGETVALLGRNGMGKSTTLKSIMGLLRPRSGRIVFKNKDITKLSLFKKARQGMGYVPEERRIFPHLSIQENLLIGSRNKTGEGAWDLDRVYHHFPVLDERKAMSGAYLSGGEQQMLSIARALMGNPDLLLVDEPTEGLAPIMVQKVAAIIKEISYAGVSILLVEHNLNAALALADRVYLMGKAYIGYEGTAKDLEQNPDIRSEFLEV